jgi:hypothetical protein
MTTPLNKSDVPWTPFCPALAGQSVHWTLLGLTICGWFLENCPLDSFQAVQWMIFIAVKRRKK